MLKHSPRYDIVVLIITFLLTVFTNLVIAVNIGVILAMLFFIRPMYQAINVEKQTFQELEKELGENLIKGIPDDTLFYTIQGPFFFGVAEKIEHTLAITHSDPT